MSYFNGSGGYNNFTTGARVPFVPPSAIYCDECAETRIPLPGVKGDVLRHQGTGFKWAPRYGSPCTSCGEAA